MFSLREGGIENVLAVRLGEFVGTGGGMVGWLGNAEERRQQVVGWRLGGKWPRQDEAAVRRQAACCKKLVLDGRGEVIAFALDFVHSGFEKRSVGVIVRRNQYKAREQGELEFLEKVLMKYF